MTKPFYITFEQIITQQDRIAIAQGFKDYITRYPRRFKTDSVEFEGKKHLRQVIAGGIDLPGTFIAFSNTESRMKYYTAWGRETSFGKWTRILYRESDLSSMIYFVMPIISNLLFCVKPNIDY